MIRLLPFETAPGAYNMAADETLLRGAAEGHAGLRFYTWSEATVSLGYFQPAAARSRHSRLEALPFVRRPSGGATLVHHHELTYCLALPVGWLTDKARAWMPRMHRIVAQALDDLGMGKAALSEGAERHDDVLCFQQLAPGDLLFAGKKIAGSAQRKHRHGLLQHGSILLALSEHTPGLPGLLELTGLSLTPFELAEGLRRRFHADTGWETNPTHWNAQEQADVQWLIENRYGSSLWNEKR